MDDRPLRGRYVLLLEDELLIRLDLAEQLETAGAEVVGTSSVDEAVRIAQGRRILDGAILDIALPDGLCWPAVRALRARGVPIALHTGHDDPEMAHDDAPDARLITKPCPPGAVIRTMVEMMAARQAAGGSGAVAIPVS